MMIHFGMMKPLKSMNRFGHGFGFMGIENYSLNQVLGTGKNKS
jgi:hypothetical protein